MENLNYTSIPAGSQDGGPAAFPFFLHIHHVQYHQNPNEPPLVPGPEFFWRPSPSGEFVTETSTGWLVWDPKQPSARLRRPTHEENKRRRLHGTSTLVWDPERHGYIHAPIDCTTESFKSFDPKKWRRLSFGRHEADETTDLAVLGHHMDDYRLHLPGPESWFEQLLPDVCQAQVDSEQKCRLAGYLSILVGLLAFGVKPDEDYKAIIASFRPDMFSTRFRPHQLQANPRHKKRSMVIEIGFDPERTSSDQLSAWERGDNGEMFS